MNPPADDRRTRILDERTAALARRGVAGPEAAAIPVCVLTIGSGVFAVPLALVAAVSEPRPVAPLPGTAPGVVGIAHVGGRFAAVVDPAMLLGASRAEPGGGGHMVALRLAPPVILPVDRVIGTAAAIPDRQEEGVARIRGLHGVDVARLLDPPKLIAPLFPSVPGA